MSNSATQENFRTPKPNIIETSELQSATQKYYQIDTAPKNEKRNKQKNN
jgi:hypothetical protein